MVYGVGLVKMVTKKINNTIAATKHYTPPIRNDGTSLSVMRVTTSYEPPLRPITLLLQ